MILMETALHRFEHGKSVIVGRIAKYGHVVSSHVGVRFAMRWGH